MAQHDPSLVPVKAPGWTSVMPCLFSIDLRVSGEFVLVSTSRLVAAIAALLFVKIFTSFLPMSVYGDQTLIAMGIGLLVTLGIGPLANAFGRYFHDCVQSQRVNSLFDTTAKYYAGISVFMSIALALTVYLIYRENGGLTLSIVAVALFIGTGVNRLTQQILNTARWRFLASLSQILVSILTILIPLGFIAIWTVSLTALIGGLAAAQLIVAVPMVIGAIKLQKVTRPGRDAHAENRTLSNPVPLISVIGQDEFAQRPLEKEMLRFALPFVPIYLCGWIMSFADRYFIGAVQGSSSVAVYSVAYMVGSMPLLMITDVFGQLVPPILFQSSSEGKSTERALKRWMGIFLLILVPVGLAVILLSSQLVDLIAGIDYAVGAAIVPFIVVGHLCYATAIMLEIKFRIAKKTIILAWVVGALVVINLVGNAIAVPSGGIMAAAVVTGVTYGLQLVCYLFFGRHLLY